MRGVGQDRIRHHPTRHAARAGTHCECCHGGKSDKCHPHHLGGASTGRAARDFSGQHKTPFIKSNSATGAKLSLAFAAQIIRSNTYVLVCPRNVRFQRACSDCSTICAILKPRGYLHHHQAKGVFASSPSQGVICIITKPRGNLHHHQAKG